MRTTTLSELAGQLGFALEMYEKEEFANCRQRLNEIFALNSLERIEKALKDGTDKDWWANAYKENADMLQTLKLNHCEDGTPYKTFHKRVLALLLESRDPDFKTSFQKIFQQEFSDSYLKEIDSAGRLLANANIIAEKMDMDVKEFIIKCFQIPGLEFQIVFKPAQKD